MNFFHLVLLLLVLNSTVAESTNKAIPKFTLVEVSPSALGVMINSFDQLIVYFHTSSDQNELEQAFKKYQPRIKEIQQAYPSDHTLFCYINKTKDKDLIEGMLGSSLGLVIKSTHFQREIQSFESLFEKYQNLVHPKISLIYDEDYKKMVKNELLEHPINLVFQFSLVDEMTNYNKIYEKIYYHIEEQVRCFMIPKINKTHPSVSLYINGQIFTTYDLYNRTSIQAAQELIQRINIDTLPTVTYLDQSNFHKVFGGSVPYQLMLIHKKSQTVQLGSILKAYEKAAHVNRFEALAYERVLFTVSDAQFFESNFNQNITEQLATKQYIIYLTKTDYDRFQLKKYKMEYLTKTPTSQQLLTFIEDVRAKRLDPEYKSQPIPSQQQQSKHLLRKIVGHSFISEIYEKPNQSVLVLFIDSKDEQSHRRIKSLLEQFTLKYEKEINGKLIPAIFDLDKNQHKLLYLKQAPQLILFDKSNKKATKYIKLRDEASLQELSLEIRRGVTNVEWAHNDL